MIKPLTHPQVARPLLRGICLVVTGNEKTANQRDQPPATPGTMAKFPRRPDARILSETIRLFLIGRNKNGLWVAREAEGRTDGVFLLKRSAVRFAVNNSAPAGCATMFLTERFELDVENHGSAAVVGLDAVMRMATWRAPRLAGLIATAVVAGRKLRARIARALSGDRVRRAAT
jgi:hypothetical protein